MRQRIWFNPGVIGMPANDGTPNVWYGLIWTDGDDLILSTHRLAYDHPGAAAALRASGHADGYARSLITGLWPSIDVLPRRERAASGKRIREQTIRFPMRTLEQVAAVDADRRSTRVPPAPEPKVTGVVKQS